MREGQRREVREWRSMSRRGRGGGERMRGEECWEGKSDDSILTFTGHFNMCKVVQAHYHTSRCISGA